MKICETCKFDLLLENFGKNRYRADGLCSTCRLCKSKQDKKYRDGHKDKLKQKSQNYYLNNKERLCANASLYSKNNRVKCRAWRIKSKNKLKAVVFAKYSDGDIKCKMCANKYIDILSIDHINGNGAEHRRQIGNSKGGGYNFYQWLKKNNYPYGFQVLCYNCQFRKKMIEMRPVNPTHLQLVRAKYARLVKTQCLEKYGGCICACGEIDMDVLSLDHINDDGNKHRKDTNSYGYSFYIMLRKNGFPNNIPLQTMCLNCQIKKRNEVYAKGKNRQTIDSNGSTLAA